MLLDSIETMDSGEGCEISDLYNSLVMLQIYSPYFTRPFSQVYLSANYNDVRSIFSGKKPTWIVDSSQKLSRRQTLIKTALLKKKLSYLCNFVTWWYARNHHSGTVPGIGSKQKCCYFFCSYRKFYFSYSKHLFHLPPSVSSGSIII